MDIGPDDTDPEVIRVLARLLTDLGQVLDDIEACATQAAREADKTKGDMVSSTTPPPLLNAGTLMSALSIAGDPVLSE
ncbi:hypothetical protein PG988_010565 [Apiospora saccharicola]